jgi:hypothetical protein
MLLIRTVPVIRVDLNYLCFPLDPGFRISPIERKNTLLREGLAAKWLKTGGNGSFLLGR